MKSQITAFINNLIIYDYILFGSVFVLFILFIILGIVLRKKTFLAIFFIIIGFSFLAIGSTIGYKYMHQFLYKNTTTLTSQKKLEYTKAIVIKGDIKNESKFNFKRCRVTARAHKVSKNKYKNYILKFKTIQKSSIVLENIKKGESREFKFFIEPFSYKHDYNISISSECK